MGNEIDLIQAPQSKRNIEARKEAKNAAIVLEAKKYGKLYFDGPREYGYGGYHYDGRWKAVGSNICRHFNLEARMRVLDVGCAKGFLVHDLWNWFYIEAFGLDVSEYALTHCPPSVVGRLHLGSADKLPFPDGSFDCVVSFNTLHNLPRDRLLIALQEIMRVLTPAARNDGRAFVQMDSYHTPEQKALFEDWVLTAEFHDYPDGWKALFKEAGYTGDYFWTVVR